VVTVPTYGAGMEGQGGALRFCPACGANVADFEAPRFCASCGRELTREQANRETQSGQVSPPATPPPPAAPRQLLAPKPGLSGALRVWPGWAVLVFAVSSSTGMRQSIEDGEQVAGSGLLLVDVLLAGSTLWLIWRYIKRWRYRRSLADVAP
jgi:hypothetical protein